jgi:hypothetical protein
MSNANLISQLMQSDLWDVDPVDEDRSSGGFDDPEEAEHQRRFSGTGPTNNSDLFGSGNFERDLTQDQIETLPVKYN